MMAAAVKSPDVMTVVMTFAGPEEINGRRGILRIRCLWAPAVEVMRQAVSPRRMTVRLWFEIETAALKYSAGFFDVHFLCHCALPGKTRLHRGKPAPE